MIGFTLEEIYGSMLYAVIWGAVFCTAFSLFRLLLGLFGAVGNICRSIFVYDRIFSLPTAEKLRIKPQSGAFCDFFSVLIFTLGFSVISYLSLDGEIRLYMLILSFASFYLSKSAFFDVLNRVLGAIISVIILALCLPLRIIFLPLKMLFLLFKKVQNKF